MIEPASKTTGIVLLMVWLFGPEVGAKLGPSIVEGMVTLGGAVFGASLAASRVTFRSTTHMTLYMLAWVGGACMLASFAGHMIESLTSFQAWRWPGGVAFLITLFADKWPDWVTLGARRRVGLPDDDKAAGGGGS
jgi:hypothetical protein